jgi:exodeoxyribonuclease VIII
VNAETLEHFMVLAKAGQLMGKFAGIDGDDYHKKLPGYSKTDIEYASLSLANMVAKRELDRNPTPADEEEDENKALLLGRMLHARLEHHPDPGPYQQLFVTKPKFSGEGARKREADFWDVHADSVVITEAQERQIEGMYRGLLRNPQSRALLNAKGIAEETVIWIDPDSGLVCKCRPDRRVFQYLGAPVTLDYKTLGQFDEKHIREALHSHHYNVSAAYTSDGIRAVGEDPGTYIFVFVETKSPYRVACVPANTYDMELGVRRYKALLKQIANAEKTGIWPGFIDIAFTDWQRNHEMEAIEKLENAL